SRRPHPGGPGLRRSMWVMLAIAGSVPGRRAEDQAADRRALARMAQGAHDALAELYDRHARPVYSLALRILQDRSDAEDVVQEAFAEAWTHGAACGLERRGVDAGGAVRRGARRRGRMAPDAGAESRDRSAAVQASTSRSLGRRARG